MITPIVHSQKTGHRLFVTWKLSRVSRICFEAHRESVRESVEIQFVPNCKPMQLIASSTPLKFSTAKISIHVTTMTSCKKLLGAPGRTTRSKDATRGSWPYY